MYLILALLTSCSLIDKPASEPKKFILLTHSQKPSHDMSKKSMALEVVSEVPVERPYIKINPYQIEFLAHSQWQENLDLLVYQAIKTAFQDAGISIYKNGDSRAEHSVTLHIRNFGLEYQPHKKIMHLSYFVEMRHNHHGPVMKQKLFETSKNYLWVNDEKYIADLNETHNQLTQDILRWLSS